MRFYVETIGLRVAMEQDGMVMLVSPTEPTTQVIVAWESVTATDPQVTGVDLSIEVGDVDAAHAEATRRGMEIVYPLTEEPWGIRRYFLRDPSGMVVNVAQHI